MTLTAPITEEDTIVVEIMHTVAVEAVEVIDGGPVRVHRVAVTRRRHIQAAWVVGGPFGGDHLPVTLQVE